MATYVVAPSVGGLGLFGLMALLTSTPDGGPVGWPLAFRSPISPCPPPDIQPFSGCGFHYDLGLVLVDYWLWVAFDLVMVLVTTTALRHKRC